MKHKKYNELERLFLCKYTQHGLYVTETVFTWDFIYWCDLLDSGRELSITGTITYVLCTLRFVRVTSAQNCVVAESLRVVRV